MHVGANNLKQENTEQGTQHFHIQHKRRTFFQEAER